MYKIQILLGPAFLFYMLLVKMMRWMGHVACMGGKSEGKRPLTPRCRWERSIQMGHEEIEWEGRDWIRLAQDMGRVVGCFECDDKPWHSAL